MALVMALSLGACGASDEGGAMNAEGDGFRFWNFGDKSDALKPGDSYDVADEDIAMGEPEAGNDGAQKPSDGETTKPGEPQLTIPENPVIKTADNNVSTFSADVDTASYSYFRKLVQEYGYDLQTLQSSMIHFRTEEFINYFKYDVAEPKESELFGVHTELSPCPWNQNAMLLRLTLQAEQAKPTAGNNLVFLIDVSGSMSSQDKLPLLKKSFAYLAENLGPDDTVSIVTYSGAERVVLEGCKGSDSQRILAAINGLESGGSTNGEAGLTMAYRIAESYMIEGGNNRIIMASDGDLNVGISSAEELKQYVEEKRGQGVYLSVLGFGSGNYKDGNMEALADNGNGVYYYIDGLTEAEKVFGTDLLGTLYTVAEDVKLQLTFDKEIVESYRLIGYENRIMNEEDFRDDTKDAGEVGASHQVTVCYEIVLNGDEVQVKDSYMTLAVRYKNPGEPVAREDSYEIGYPQITDGESEDMEFISAVIELTMLLRNSKYAEGVTIEGIYAKLAALDLENAYQIEFRELVKSLVD